MCSEHFWVFNMQGDFMVRVGDIMNGSTLGGSKHIGDIMSIYGIP